MKGNENEIAVKIMAIQRIMTPAASAQLFPFVRWRRVTFPTQAKTTFRSGVILNIIPAELALIQTEKNGDDSRDILRIGF